jgi:hypothetical protein
MGAVMSAGYSSYYATPSMSTLKDMLLNFEGLVDTEGFRADRNILKVARAGPAPSSSHKPQHKKAKKGSGQGKGKDTDKQ